MKALKTRLCLLGVLSGMVISGVIILQWSASGSVAVARDKQVLKDRSISNSGSVVNADTKQSSAQNELSNVEKELLSKQAIIKRQRAEIERMAVELANYQNGTVDEMEDDFEDQNDDLADYNDFSEANITLLDETINNEQADFEWSSDAIGQINDVLATEEFTGSELISTNCAATLCRVETLQSNPDATEQFIADFPLLISWSGSAFAQIINHENGNQSVIYFISRDGYQLPRAET